jgi:hypothetical protein
MQCRRRLTSMLVHFSVLSARNSFMRTRCAMSAMLPSCSGLSGGMSSLRGCAGRVEQARVRSSFMGRVVESVCWGESVVVYGGERVSEGGGECDLVT